MEPFKIGINMAGAVSAGAYTAGVLDFLTEALDAWYAQKTAGAPVPPHDVCIEVFSGASAGGMCAAISAVLLQQPFEHIHQTTVETTAETATGAHKSRQPVENTTNRLYESWVNKIDIKYLLDTSDLGKDKPVVSLLNSTILEDIAEYALTPPASLPALRPYVSPDLTLFLSLTNLRGMPYSLNAAAPGSIEETTFFYGDRISFRTTRTGDCVPFSGSVRPLNLNQPGSAGGWDTLQIAAMATGAFPVFLAPRILQRFVQEFVPPHWMSVSADADGTPAPVQPNFPDSFAEPFVTLNVDGGMTNNDPFNYAHDYLASLSPPSPDGINPHGPLEADRAVINIAPFPTVDKFDPDFEIAANSTVLSAISKLFSALISQSRFYGESLSGIMSGATFSRFVIAPSDHEVARKHQNGRVRDEPSALQCATLGAFGGFFERKFRAHDYQLGRRNCQKFLQDSFVLPLDNPVMKTALAALNGESRQAIIDKYQRPAPGTYAHTALELQQQGMALPAAQAEAGPIWLPIIPLCTELVATGLPAIAREKIEAADLDAIVNLIMKRYKELSRRLIDAMPSALFRLFLRLGQPAIRFLIRTPLKQGLIKSLGDCYQP